MEWRKKRGSRGLLGHLHGYGCQIRFIETEEELIVLAATVFDVPLGNSEEVDLAINEMKTANRSACRRMAYNNIMRMWDTVSPFWIETEYLTRLISHAT